MERAVKYVFNSQKSELSTNYPAEFKIAGENRYVWKFCMNLVSAVCRPAGHKITYYTAEFKIARETGTFRKSA